MPVPNMPLADVRRADFQIPHQTADRRTTAHFLFYYQPISSKA
jgi:hypothetical protein